MKTASATTVSVAAEFESMSRNAAERFRNLSSRALRERGRFTVALSGGATPKRLYSLLAAPPFRDGIDWSRVFFFFADERCVPPDDDFSNFKLLYDTLFSRIPVPAVNIHRIHGELDPDSAARAYEREIRDTIGSSGLPAFDLILLGVGSDGHTASLFPGSAAVFETRRYAVPVYLDKPGVNRVTLTFPVINHAAVITILAAGRDKAGIIQKVLTGAQGDLPAARVRPDTGELVWILDRDAAQKIDAGTARAS